MKLFISGAIRCFPTLPFCVGGRLPAAMGEAPEGPGAGVGIRLGVSGDSRRLLAPIELADAAAAAAAAAAADGAGGGSGGAAAGAGSISTSSGFRAGRVSIGTVTGASSYFLCMFLRASRRFCLSFSISSMTILATSLPLDTASCMQYCSGCMSMGRPPALWMAHRSPCWLTATDSRPRITDSSADDGSTTNVSASSKKPNEIRTGRWWTLSGTGSLSSDEWMMACEPDSVTSSFLKCSTPHRAARADASQRFPSSSSARMSTRSDHTLAPPSMQRLSTSMARLPLRSRSTRLHTSMAASLVRPSSNSGEAMGP
mmetsp:Transcript_4970/g.13520  ORF Transcript_4970/g.13520 Transcript_4970/m.13520 type:complete len:314 (-) Transcript_4970:281-1222(-)